MDDLSFRLLGIQWSQAGAMGQIADPSWPTILYSALVIFVFSAWTVTLLAIAHSERHGFARKVAWGATALALPVLGSALWLFSNKNTPTRIAE